MAETLKLCVSCKACRRECPTGVDMARMKIEVQAARAAKHGLSLHDRRVGYLPRYAPYAAKVPWLMNARDTVPGVPWVSQVIAGFSHKRTLPKWASKTFDDMDILLPFHDEPAVVLFADTFNRYFEPENLVAAIDVLNEAGYATQLVDPVDGGRPLCCGRTFLSVGLVEEAKHEAERTLEALSPYLERGVPIIGLEPSCILGFRDEIPAIVKSEAAQQLADNAFLFEEFLAREAEEGRFMPPLAEIGKRVLVHGHCHQKSFDAMGSVEKVLRLIPGVDVEAIESSCCGMAGSFGFAVDTIDVSLAMGELSLLPAVRNAPSDAIIVADGTSCRHQIHDGTGREAMHVARVLAASIAADRDRLERLVAERARGLQADDGNV
jgi:Fe-S oxidoreductase